MADNTSVGSVSISLDLDVSSNISKQLNKATQDISSKIKSGLESSLGKVDLSKDAQKVGKSLSDGIENSVKKLDLSYIDDLLDSKFSSDALEKQAQAQETAFEKAAEAQRKLNEELNREHASMAQSVQQTAVTVEKKSILASVTERLKNTFADLRNPLKQSSKQLHDVSNSSDDAKKSVEELTEATNRAGPPMINMKSFGRSLVRQMLGLQLAIRLVGQAVRKMAQGFWESLKSNEDFNNSLNQVKSNLLIAFQPIYEAILPAMNALMSALAKATAMLASFVSLLFGKTVKASTAGAKSLQKATKGMKEYGKAAKATQQITAGFDQLHDITEDKGGGGGGAGGGGGGFDIIEPDTSTYESALSKLKDKFDALWNTATMQSFFDSFRTIGVNSFNLVKQIGGTIWDNVKLSWEEMAPFIFGGFGNIVERWRRVFEDIALTTTEWFPIIGDTISEAIDNVFETFRPLTTFIAQIWFDMTQIMLDLWNEHGATILDRIGEFINGMIDTFNKIWTHILDPIITPAIQFLKDMWDEHVKEILFMIGDFVGHMISEALRLYNEFIKPIVDWLVVKLGPIFEKIFKFILDVATSLFTKMFEGIKKTLQGLRTAFDGLITFLEGVFTLNWKKMWDGIKQMFSGFWTAIIGYLGYLTAGFRTFIEYIGKGFKLAWEKAWNGIKTFFANIRTNIANSVTNLINAFKNFASYISNAFSNAFRNAFNGILSFFRGIGSSISGVATTIKNAFVGVINYLRGAFTNAWSSIWRGLVNTFKNIVSGIANIFKAPINAMARGLNTFINGLNKIKIPSWVPGVGGKGINIGKIPMLASGGVLTEPTLNIAGEYPGARSNPEIVTPQNIMKDTFREVMSEFLDAFMSGAGMGGVSQQAINLVVNIGGNKLLETFIDLAKEYTKQTGKEVIVVG